MLTILPGAERDSPVHHVSKEIKEREKFEHRESVDKFGSAMAVNSKAERKSVSLLSRKYSTADLESDNFTIESFNIAARHRHSNRENINYMKKQIGQF